MTSSAPDAAAKIPPSIRRAEFSACQKSPCRTFLTALSAGRFDAVKTPLRANGLVFKPFDGGLSHLRRALPPQAPPRLSCFSLCKRFLTVSIPPISHCTGYGGNSACQKSPCGTFLTALSAGRFDSVKTPLRANGLFSGPLTAAYPI